MAVTPTFPVIVDPWGNTNTSSADMVQPGAGLQNTGFLPPPVVPDREHVNWLFNWVMNAVRYLLVRGIPAWSASETLYVIGSHVNENGLEWILTSGAATTGLAPHLDTTHWSLAVPIPPGTILSTRVLVAASGTSIAKTAGTERARVWIYGNGGGGAGVVGPNASGGGGSAGGFGYWETTTIPANWAIVWGAAGVGGTGADGTAGGNTTFNNGSTTVTVSGGPGGLTTGLGGDPAAITTNATINGSGEPGGSGVVFDAGTGFFAISGKGGSHTSIGGAGGKELTSGVGVLAGKNAVGPASGGGGAMANGAGTAKGGDATAALIVLQELS